MRKLSYSVSRAGECEVQRSTVGVDLDENVTVRKSATVVVIVEQGRGKLFVCSSGNLSDSFQKPCEALHFRRSPLSKDNVGSR